MQLSIERYPNSNEISYITPLIDYISLAGYEKNVSNYEENAWIPVCISEENLVLVENRIAKIFYLDKFYVWMIMATLPYMLNTIVVQEMAEQNENNKYFTRYLNLAHIFVLFAKKYPEIRRLSDKKIYSFTSNDWNRSKKSTPSIGALISTLLVSENFNWLDIAYPALNESFSRNVKWVLNHHPELVENVNIDVGRVDKTFKSTLGSLKLLMLHVGYLKIVKKNFDFWKCYDLLKITKGIPTEKMLNSFTEFRNKVYNTENWENFFEIINLSKPKESYLLDWLKKSVIHSKKRKYHISSKNNVINDESNNFDIENTSIYDGIL